MEATNILQSQDGAGLRSEVNCDSSSVVNNNMKVVSATYIHSYFRKRDNGKTSSVVQNLFRREIGGPYYTRGAATVSRFYNEKSIMQSLIKLQSREEIDQEPDIVHLRTTNNSKVSSNSSSKKKEEVELPESGRLSVGWLKVKVDSTQHIIYMDGILMAIKSLPSHSESIRNYVTQFYTLSPDYTSGFKKLLHTYSYSTSTCIISMAWVKKASCVTDVKKMHAGFLVLLFKDGWIHLFDYMHGRSTKLVLKSSYGEGLIFSDLKVTTSTKKIYVQAIRKGKGQSIYALKYVNESNRLKVEYVLNVAFDATAGLGSRVSFYSYKCLDISNWKTLLSEAEPTKVKISDTQDSDTDCADIYEHVLNRKPQTLQTIQFEESSSIKSLLGLFSSPLVCVAETIKRRIITKIVDLDTQNMLWKVSNKPNEPKVMRFIDGSPRYLYFEKGQHKMMTLKRNEQGIVEVDPKSGTRAFFVPLKPMLGYTVNRTRQFLPRSSKKKIVRQSTNFEVLGQRYCPDLDLIAVCLLNRDDNGRFLQVSLYEAKNLSLFATLPRLNALPNQQGLAQDQKKIKDRCTVVGFRMNFSKDQICIFLSCGVNNRKTDIFLYQLL